MGGSAEYIKDTERGGGEAVSVRIFLQIHRPVGVALWCRGLGGYSPYGTGPRVFPEPGGMATGGATAMSEVG